MRRTITGRTGNRKMALGDLRQFLASIEGLPDEALIRAKVTTFGRHLRSVTVEEEDVGFRDYMRAVKPGEDEAETESAGRAGAGGRPAGS